MIRLAKPLGILFLLANLIVAALWVTILHPASTGQASRAADPAAVDPLVVGAMFVPPHDDCPVPVSASSPVTAPPGAHLAQFVPVPASLAQSVAVTLPPCSGGQVAGLPSMVPRQPPALAGVNFHIVGQIRYTGSLGTVLASTTRPSAAVFSHRLDMGNPAGTLPDGTTTYAVVGMQPQNQIRWLKDGLLITVASDDVSLSELKTLAAQLSMR